MCHREVVLTRGDDHLLIDATIMMEERDAYGFVADYLGRLVEERSLACSSIALSSNTLQPRKCA